jgi:glycosyltransferase involved in cell wall biosynthesis
VKRAPRVLVTVGTDASRDTTAGPRRDYAVLADSLSATILDSRAVERSLLARFIRRTIGLPPAQAWLAFTRRGDFDVIVTDGEHVGIPLAFLLRFSRSHVKHVTIAHRLSAPKKRIFFRMFRVQRRIDGFALHSRRQYDLAADDLALGRERLTLVPYQVDTKFWIPGEVDEQRLVVSAGLEHRDYATLFRAVAGLDTDVVIGAASHWSRHAHHQDVVPTNVRVGTFDYTELRALYARAAIVVIPLADVDNQAGVTTILEAMAMAKPVIVTQSLGQTDVVEDRRRTARAGTRPRPKSLARLFAERAQIALEPNGFYVAPGDADGLRRAIQYLLAHPEERRRLGQEGRALAENLFSVEAFARRMRSLVIAVHEETSILALEPSASFG